MSWTVTIDGVEFCPTGGGISVRNRLNEIPTGQLSLTEATAGLLDFQEGDPVLIEYDGTELFGGYVSGVRVTESDSGVKGYNIDLEGWAGDMRRRLVFERYTNKTAGYIVSDIIARYLVAEGFTAGDISDGAEVARLIVNGRNALDVVRNLAAANGFIFWVEPDKTVHFGEPAMLEADFAIDSEWEYYQSLNVQVNVDNYRNKVVVDGFAVTDTQTEIFSGDGGRRTFGVAFPMWEKPTVRVNGVEKTVGILGLSAGNDWYWSKFSQDLTQDEAAGALTTDGRVVAVNVGANVPYLRTIQARGDYALAVWYESGTLNRGLVLFKIEGGSILEVYRLPIVTDETSQSLSAFWVDDETVLVQYYNVTPNEWTQKIYKRVGDLLIGTGASMNELPIFHYEQSGNGRHIAGIKSVFMGYDTVLWVYDKDAGTLSVGDTLAFDANYNAPNMAVEGAYMVQYLTHVDGVTASQVRLFKINPTADTFTLADTLTVTGSFTTAGGWTVIIGEYVFVLMGVSPNINMKIYKIDTAADTLSFVGDWVSPSWVNALSPSVQRAARYGDKLVLSGNFAGGDLAILKFDVESESLTVAHFLENEINGYVSVSDRGWGIYDSIAAADDRVRLFEFRSDLLEVEYKGVVRTMYAAQDVADVAHRASVNGGTGLWEIRESLPRDRAGEVVEYARRRLSELSLNRQLSYRLGMDRAGDGKGLRTGMRQYVDVPAVGYAGFGIITDVSFGMVDVTGMATSVGLVQGNITGTWQQFLRLLWGKQTGEIVSDDLLQIPLTFGEVAEVDDDAEIVVETITYEWDETEWDEGEWL